MTEHGRWVEAQDLKEGDVLKDQSGEGLIITSLSSRQEKTDVYNLNVEGYHNYAVNQKGILVPSADFIRNLSFYSQSPIK